MKKFLLAILLLFFTFIILLAVSGCSMTSPVEDVKVIFNSMPITTVISGNIVDAATKEPIQNKTVYLTIEGDNKNDVVDLTSTPKTSFNTDVGFVDFALTESVKPRESAPVKIVIVAKCDGYITTCLPLKIAETGSANFVINMVNQNNLPKGVVSSAASGTSDNNGIVQSDFTVKVKENIANVNASMLIPKGTALYDANGNPLKGNITASIVYFNNKSEESLSAFPGGFTVTTNEGGVKNEGVFLTAGFFELTIKDAYGTEAKTFVSKSLKKINTDDVTKPLTIIEIAKGTMNPETNAEVKAGDSIDVWSLDNNTAVWNQELKAKIYGPNDNGNFYVQFGINHLSPYNCDWRWWWCPQGATINVIGKPAGYPIRMVVIGSWGMYYDYISLTDNSYTFRWIPMGIPAVVIAYDGCRSTELGRVYIGDLCSGTYNLSVNIPTVPVIEYIVYAEGFCSCNSDIIVRTNGIPIWYRDYYACASSWVYAGFINNGSLNIPSIIKGNKYIYATWFNGAWYAIGATVYDDRAEIDAGISTQNIIYSQIYRNDAYTYLRFRGQLSTSICKDFCK